MLPGETKQFAGPLSGLVRSVAPGGVEKVLETTTAQSLWEDANRSAHEQLVAVLENKKEAVATDEGNVKLNLGSLVTNLADQVGIGASLAEKLPAGRRPDDDPALRPAEDRAEHRRRASRAWRCSSRCSPSPPSASRSTSRATNAG